MTAAVPAERAPATIHRPPLGARLSRAVLPAFTAIAVAYLFLPIAVMIIFSFNDPLGRQNITWQGFTLENYLTVWGRPDITGPMLNSIIIATVTTVISCVLGTLIGLALTRYQFRGRGSLNLLIYIPMATPEVILGASLLALWVSADVQRGMPTIVIAHVMFCISFVVVTIRARISGFNRSLEEAAMDLGADEVTTFRKVTLPLIFPGILAAALLSFALSIDDYVVTSFIAGQTSTFPLWVYGASRFGVPPEVNVLGTLIFAFAFTMIVLQILWGRRRRAEDQALAKEGQA
ncbi:MAG TPA: ABC transporter permease [Candidatus Limnocylindrales bacterium]|nr:ABC transporter permease [Candidatus Limnocylindrales bacterium]